MSTDHSRADSDESTYVGFDLEDVEEKRAVRIRAAQLGYPSMAHYVRALIRNDLEDADI